MAELNLKSFTRIVPTLTYIVRIDRFRNYISIKAYSTTRIALIISIEATVLTLTYAVRFRNYISIRTHSTTRITLVILIERIICFNYFQATNIAELNLKSFTRIPTFTYIVRTNRFKNYISIRANSITRIVLTISAEAIICFYRLWYIAKAGLNTLKFFTTTVLTLAHIVRIDRFRSRISIRAYSVTRIVLIISIEAIICFYYLQYVAKTGSNILKNFTITVPTLAYAVRADRFGNRISIRAHSATRIVLIISIEAITCFYYSWYVTKTGSNISKIFIITVPTLAHVVRTDRFRSYISTRAYSATRIVLTIFIEATIYFYRLWYIAKAGLNALKFLIVTVLTLTYTVRTDRFRNYISIEIHYATRIILAISIKATIYFNFLQDTGIARSILKSFTRIVPTFTYIVRIGKFRNYISIRAYSTTRIVLTTYTGTAKVYYIKYTYVLDQKE